MKSINLDSIADFINRMASEKRLDPELKGQLEKSIKNLNHGLVTKNFKKVFKAIDEVSRILSKV